MVIQNRLQRKILAGRHLIKSKKQNNKENQKILTSTKNIPCGASLNSRQSLEAIFVGNRLNKYMVFRGHQECLGERSVLRWILRSLRHKKRGLGRFVMVFLNFNMLNTRMKIMNQAFKKRKGIKWLFQMEAYMKVSGTKVQTHVTAEVIKFGQMAQYMMAIGRMIKQMDEVDWFMLMATFTMAIGKMIKLMVSVFINISKELNTKDIGKMINNMVKEKKNGLMERNTRAHTNTERKKVSVRSTGQMDRVTRATS